MEGIKQTVTAKVDTTEHKEILNAIREKLEEASSLMDELASTPLEVKIKIE